MMKRCDCGAEMILAEVCVDAGCGLVRPEKRNDLLLAVGKAVWERACIKDGPGWIDDWLRTEDAVDKAVGALRDHCEAV